MAAGERDEVAVGDLIRASHQFHPAHAVGATQAPASELKLPPLNFFIFAGGELFSRV